MRDEIELLRAARPTVAGPGRELTRQRKRELMASIAVSHRLPRSTSGRRRVLLATAALAPVAATIVLALTLFGRGDDTAWASAVEVARAAPRLLVGQPGWEITRADELSVGYGEMTFARGRRRLDLHWGPGRDYTLSIEKRSVDQDAVGTITVAGDTARVFRYRGTTDFTAVWLRDGTMVEARELAAGADAPQPAAPGVRRRAPAIDPARATATLSEFKATVASLREVDVASWLAAMPDSVVEPASRSEIVDEMLAGLPLPDGFDSAPLRSGNAIRDRYQLGAQVAGAVACAWMDRWVVARRAGDENGVRRATTAMASSHRWPILLEMQEKGDYPKVLWEVADSMAANRIVMGKPFTVVESYASALGCPSP
jgi:hypothetical protein